MQVLGDEVLQEWSRRLVRALDRPPGRVPRRLPPADLSDSGPFTGPSLLYNGPQLRPQARW